MLTELVQALRADVRRLLNAGATVAPSDERLQRRAMALRALASQIPALQRLVEGIEQVLTAGPGQAARPLLSLLMLVRQVEARLAASGVVGELTPIPDGGTWQTVTPIKQLWSIQESLRFSHLTAERRKMLCNPAIVDLRLIDFLLGVLTRGADEMGDLVAEHTLPAFGPAVVSELERGLDGASPLMMARRLLALTRIDATAALSVLCRTHPEAGAAVCHALLNAGPNSLKTVAQHCLRSMETRGTPPSETAASSPQKKLE